MSNLLGEVACLRFGDFVGGVRGFKMKYCIFFGYTFRRVYELVSSII